MALWINDTPRDDWPDSLEARFGLDAVKAPRRLLEACPVDAETPLIQLNGLASRLGVRRIWWKDESARMRLTSFKALGGVFAVARLLERRVAAALKSDPEPQALIGGAASSIAEDMTVTTATDGNHGLSVAAGAAIFKMKCVIFVHSRVEPHRIKRLEAKGAEVRVVPGVFDDAVAEAQRVAEREGWHLIADTSESLDDLASGDVVQGYSVLADELDRQLGEVGAEPSHVFCQAGVGGMAAAVIAGLKARREDDAPLGICVEPEAAPALFASLQAGRPQRAEDVGGSVMDMLDCHAPSRLAFEALARCAHAFMTVSDADAAKAVKLLAEGHDEDPVIETSATAAAGLAGLVALLRDEELRKKAGLGAGSEIVLIGTEGAAG
ncbi:diaminopropionate ammonia-lyase [Marinicauda pacifica]|uniref:diaminopropionate ammonia-lyase n=1 Tax=Marinicauda pacifica TaxID=1133559 RepID=UPI0013053579|nr:diaminopropionate ammonia-lyase [Marinicauda pacifica]GGE39227.1 diaminopropionate ammonia-lyase [Marinicauda pacifica]